MDTGSDNHQLLSDINVTPFVDVMLVLLVIFMVAAPMMVQGVDVDLPKATSKPLKGEREKLIISVDEDRKVYVNDQSINVEYLTDRLEGILDNFSERNVYLRADKQVPYGIVINVVSKIKEAGVDSLGMITLPEEKEQS
ncbi:MAG: protein TolR [Desulfobacteraceae bacterium]